MTYTIETIPAKIYFQIIDTGETSLLSTEEDIDTELLWETIRSEGEKLLRKESKNKVLELSKSMQRFYVKYESVKNSIFYLRRKRDEELEDLIRSFGYKITNANFEKDLDRIENKIESLKVKIAREKKKIDAIPQSQQNSSTFEDVFMSYLAILGYGFRSANSVTFKEFAAMEKSVTNKIKSIESNVSKR